MAQEDARALSYLSANLPNIIMTSRLQTDKMEDGSDYVLQKVMKLGF